MTKQQQDTGDRKKGVPGKARSKSARERFLDNAEAVIVKRANEGKRTLVDVSLASLGGGAVSRTTVPKLFSDAYDVCAALAKRHRLDGTDPHPVIATGAQFHYDRTGPDPQVVMEHGLRRRAKSLADAEQLHEQAHLSSNSLHRMLADVHLAGALIDHASAVATPAKEATECLERARKISDNALRSDVDDERDYLEAALECAALAAHSSRILSRLDDVELRYLSYVAEYKTKEADFAKRLHLGTRAAISRFHAERADALIKDDHTRALDAYQAATTALIEAKQSGEWINWSYLNMLISRMCAHQLAYPETFDETYRQIRDTLLSLYSQKPRNVSISDLDRSGGNTASSQVRTAKTLVRLVESAPDYAVVITPVDMLQVSAFGAVGHLTVARMLAGLYRKAISDGSFATGADGTSNALIPEDSAAVTAHEYLVASLDYYRRALENTRRSGSAGVLREQGSTERQLLLQELGDAEAGDVHLPPMQDETIATLIDVINKMVMVSLVTGRSNHKQLLLLSKTLDPVYEYVRASRGGDRASAFHHNTDG